MAIASQPVASSSTLRCRHLLEGFTLTKMCGEPRVGEVLLLQQEPDNSEHKLAVAVLKSGIVVGHVPKNLAPVFRRSNDAVVIKLLSKLRESQLWGWLETHFNKIACCTELGLCSISTVQRTFWFHLIPAWTMYTLT